MYLPEILTSPFNCFVRKKKTWDANYYSQMCLEGIFNQAMAPEIHQMAY